MRKGLLYSCVGYDIGDAMIAYYRTEGDAEKQQDISFAVRCGDAVIKTGEAHDWGMKWGSDWKIIDISGISEPCTVVIEVRADGAVLEESRPIEIGYNLVWDKTIDAVAMDALEERHRRARNGGGWKDCGSDFREVCSITPMIPALCDLLNKNTDDLTVTERGRIITQIMVGTDHLCRYMEAAEAYGLPSGSVVHDLPNHILCIPGEVGSTAVALAAASVTLYELYPEKAEYYLKLAKQAYEYILHGLKPYGAEGFNHQMHDIPEGTAIPEEFMTRDLLMFMWAGVLLYKAGQHQYRDSIIDLGDRIMKRQIPESEAEDGIFGHFYMYDSLKVSEKAWCHHGIGYDTGGVIPAYILPFIEICGLWQTDVRYPEWIRMIKVFTEDYFIPACERNPFGLLPFGYYKGEGWLNFCGPWHGFNAMIAFTARLALELWKIVPSDRLRRIATQNIQWICGANAGVTDLSFDTTLFWKPEIAPDRYECFSQIAGIGTRSVGCWTCIKGTIPNGFSVNSQFRFDVENKAANDSPVRYTDEDWIPHSAGFVSALAFLNMEHFYSHFHPRAKEIEELNREHG
jgi:hypothetical protein